MRYGIDVHGVADTKKRFFALFTQRAIANGHAVHIITGNMRTPEIEEELAENGIEYTHFYSVSDKLLEDGKETHWTSPNDPWFPANEWNTAKAAYCAEQGIDLHFDDSETYGQYFKTLFVKVV